MKTQLTDLVNKVKSPETDTTQIADQNHPKQQGLINRSSTVNNVENLKKHFQANTLKSPTNIHNKLLRNDSKHADLQTLVKTTWEKTWKQK